MATKKNLARDPVWNNQISTSFQQDQSTKDICGFINNSCQKRGSILGYDGFKHISGTKIHVAVESNGLPVSIVIGPANEHDSTRFIDVMESISEYLVDDPNKQIGSAYADKGYDARYIRNYLRNNGIACCIPYKTNSKFVLQRNLQTNYNRTRFVVERFFAWLKCGFHRIRIRYERIAENYLGFINVASIMMYWRVLG